MTTNAELLNRVKVLEAKLDATIRALHLALASPSATSKWLDTTIESVRDPNGIGVKNR